MNRNERTPRTLADCQWRTGYRAAEFKAHAAGFGLAVFIGIGLACVVLAWIDWSMK